MLYTHGGTAAKEEKKHFLKQKRREGIKQQKRNPQNTGQCGVAPVGFRKKKKKKKKKKKRRNEE